MLVVGALLLWLAGRFVTIPVWLTATVIGLTAFTLVGDMANIAMQRTPLRGADEPCREAGNHR